MGVTMLYQGHGSYRFETDEGVVVYVDPFAGVQAWYDKPADLILVTHEHFDHAAVDRMPHSETCEIYRAADVHPTPGTFLTFSSHGVRFTAVQAYNCNHPLEECMGLVIDFGDITFYAAGDTSTTTDMRSGKLAALHLDYAALPSDGIYTMDIPEASKAAELVAARHTIPVHLEAVSSKTDTMPAFPLSRAEAFTGPGKIILQPGDVLRLEEANANPANTAPMNLGL